MVGYYNQFFCEEFVSYSVILDDDGQVGYAFLLQDRDIISDVWLYNVYPTTKTLGWQNREDFPFLNRLDYIKDEIFEPIKSDDEIDIVWKFNGSELQEVSISIRNTLRVVMTPGSKPGKSNWVIKDGPLAKKMI